MSILPVTIDFETYYDSEYSLSKMTAEEYIRDPRFEIIGVSIQPHGKKARWFTGTLEEIRRQLAGLPWHRIWAIGHNMSMFDSLILTQVLDLHPRRWGCTLSMARQALPRRNLSLAALAEYFGLPAKGTAVHDMKGVHRLDMTDRQHKEYADYCCHDSVLCTVIFNILLPQIPAKDLQAIHWFIKMFAEPKLELDVHSYDLFADQLSTERERMLEALGIEVKALRSDAQFADLLRAEGVEPATKLNPKGVEKYAFAKTDKAMTALLNHTDDRVRTLAEARVKMKTSIEQSRVDRFRGIGRRGLLPAPILWGNTVTMRAAGGGKINLQNLSRGRAPTGKTLKGTLLVTTHGFRTLSHVEEFGDKEQDDIAHFREGGSELAKNVHCFGLRDGISAPRGKKLVVVDSSNIELRVAHTLAGQTDTTAKLWANPKADLYSEFAQDLYGYAVNKKDHPKERQHGKVGMLQLQYQSGDVSFQNAARVMGGINLTKDESVYTVGLYREKFSKLPAFWKQCGKAIKAMAANQPMAIDESGLCQTGDKCIYLPRGRVLRYPGLREEFDEEWGGMQWVYNDPRTGALKRLYGGAVTENICQALAGIIITDQCLEIEKQYGKYDRLDEGVALTVHDEAIIVVADEQAQECLAFSIKTMATSPEWWPELPLSAEGDIAQRYGNAK
jgi:hypothetical protein